MTEMSVDVGLNVQADQYLQSMGQAVAITKQYTSVANGINGKVADLNKGLVGLTNRMTGFNKVNTVAVDTAAAYQKQLAGIEAKASITNKSFAALEKTTKGMARNFPIGMGQSVEVVESLMAAGVKSEKQIDSLGKSFVRLGAATGTNAAAIGTEMLQLNKTMGNGIAQFDALSDSVVGATAKLGGSAPSVIAFSKALAPVASTVGISQTAVIGLSTAMSSLGEDGYRAANTFNKVLLDMNRSIRDGGPELKAYADLMGTTSDSLTALFKKDPTEVLSRFSDAVAKQGPNISRQLDELGFDSVRDTRSLTALARAGGPRAAINEAVASYGSGKTADAAAVAMGGVQDQAVMLKESMTQVVGNVGKPMLDIAKTQLQIANSVSGAMAKVTESGPGQAVLTGTGVAGLGAQMVGGTLAMGGMLALGKMGGRMIGGALNNPTNAFGAGRAFAMSGQALPAGAGMGANAGYMASSAMMALRPGGGLENLASQKGTIGNLAKTSMRFTASGMDKMWNSVNTNYISKEAGLGAVGQTPEGQKALASMRDSAAKATALARSGDAAGAAEARAAANAARTDLKALARSMGATPVSASAANIVRGTGTAIAGSAQLAAGGAMRAGAAGLAGLSALGITPAMLGIAAVAGGGFAAYKMHSSQDENLGKIRSSSSDIYSQYNNFAESIGKAGKGLASFSAQVAVNTNLLSDQNSTIADALKLTSAEGAQATQPGYKSEFMIQGDAKTAKGIAAQIQASFGPSVTPDVLARVMSDVANQVGVPMAQEVGKNLENFFQPRTQGGGNVDYEELQKSIGANKGLIAQIGTGMVDLSNQFGNLGPFAGMGIVGTLMQGQTNDAQTNMGIQMASAAQQKANEVGGVYGGTVSAGGQEITASSAAALNEAEKIYNGALGKGDIEKKASAEAIRILTGMTEDQVNAVGLGTGVAGPAALNNGQTFSEMMAAASDYAGPDGTITAAKNYRALKGAGIDVSGGDYSAFGTKATEQETSARELGAEFKRLTGATFNFADSMYAAEKAARSFSTTPTDLTSSQMMGMSSSEKSLATYEKDGGDNKRYAAGQALADEFIKNTSSGPAALAALQLAQSTVPVGSNKSRAYETASEIAQRQLQLDYAGRAQGIQNIQAVRVGQQAQQLPMTTNSQQNTVINSQITMGMQAQASAADQIASMNQAWGAMQAQKASINRSSGIQIGSIMRDARLNEQWATEDYNLQRRYGRQDYQKAVRRQNRDYMTSKEYAKDDYETSSRYIKEDTAKTRKRAGEDFMRQMLYAAQDYEKSVFRVKEDARIGEERAFRDFNKQIARADRDFKLGQLRAQEDFDRQQSRANADYQKSRVRAQEDLNRQVKRMVEDSAKQMYDPFKRISAQMVMDAGQLVTNLKDQTAALNKQVSNLAEVRSLGLSEEAIKALNLSDASNAQQLSRLLEDMKGNKALVDQVNQSVSEKATAAGSLATDQGNTSYSRMMEDFSTSLARADEDFATSMGRAQEDFTTQSQRASQDFATSMLDSKNDFNQSITDSRVDLARQLDRMYTDYETDRKRAGDGFLQSMQRLAEDTQQAQDRLFEGYQKQIKRMTHAHKVAMHDMKVDYDTNLERSETAFENSIKRMRIKAANAVSDVGAQAAAQVASMQEQFMQWMQSSSADKTAAANTLIGRLLGLPHAKQMGDDVKAILSMAFEQAGANAEYKKPGWLVKWEKEQGLTPPPPPKVTASGTPTAAYDVPKMDIGGTAQIPSPPDTSAWDKFFGWWTKDFSEYEAGFLDAFNPDNWRDIADNMWPDNWDFLAPDIPWATLMDNVVPDDWSAIMDGLWPDNWDFLFPDIDWASIADNLWPDNWDFLAPDIPWANVLDKFWPDTFPIEFDAPVFFDAIWPDNWDFLAPDIPWAKIGDAIWPDNWDAAVPDLSDNEFFDALWPDNWDWLLPDMDWSAVMDKIWPDNWDFIFPDLDVSGFFDGMWPDSWDFLKPDIDWTKIMHDVLYGEKGDGGLAGWLKGIPEWITKNIPGADKFTEAFGSILSGFKGILHSLVEEWNKLDFSINFDSKSYQVGGFHAGPWDPFPGIHINAIGWDGATITTPKINTGDLIPNITPNPFALGGVVKQPTNALIGEAGYPEAVIPLNERGASFMAALLGQYVSNSTIRGAQTMANSSSVVNHYSSSYDYRTQYSGSITVQANDPDEMAAKLAAKQRVQRLAQPIGGRR